MDAEVEDRNGLDVEICVRLEDEVTAAMWSCCCYWLRPRRRGCAGAGAGEGGTICTEARRQGGADVDVEDRNGLDVEICVWLGDESSDVACNVVVATGSGFGGGAGAGAGAGTGEGGTTCTEARRKVESKGGRRHGRKTGNDGREARTKARGRE